MIICFSLDQLEDNKDPTKDREKDRAPPKDSVINNKEKTNVETKDSVTVANSDKDVSRSSDCVSSKIVNVGDSDRAETSSTVSTLSSQSVEQSSASDDKSSEAKSPPVTVPAAVSEASFGATSGQEKPNDM